MISAKILFPAQFKKMGIKDKVRRASRIFSNDSKEDLAKKDSSEPTVEGTVEKNTTEAAAEPATESAAEPAAAETTEVASQTEIEPLKSEEPKEPVVETTAAEPAEVAKETVAEPATETLEPTEAAVESTGPIEATIDDKKKLNFKKYFLKFKNILHTKQTVTV